VSEKKPPEQKRASGFQRFGRSREHKKGDRDPEPGEPRSARAIHVRLCREEDERQHRGGYEGRGVFEVAEQIGTVREGQRAHERSRRPCPEPLEIEVREDAGKADRNQDEGLEGGEGFEGREEDGERIQDPAAVGGEQGRSEKLPRVEEGKGETPVRREGLDPEREMEGHAVARPEEPVVEQGLDVGDQRKEGEDKEGKGVAFEIRARQRLS
jgi:hypothetical protein